MGILQQKRPSVSQPEVRQTDYGATYVKVATENAADSVVKPLEADGPEVAVKEKPVLPEAADVAVPKKRKSGRPKKKKA